MCMCVCRVDTYSYHTCVNVCVAVRVWAQVDKQTCGIGKTCIYGVCMCMCVCRGRRVA